MRNNVQMAVLLVGAALLGGVSLPSWAVDGVVLIDQNKAMAGGVTPGDTPGFPVTISQPGSYQLAGNLTLPDAQVSAIAISASNVTLDLNGFEILGPVTCTGTPVTSCDGPSSFQEAITLPGGFGQAVNIAIMNGRIKGMAFRGIDFNNATNSRVENMVVTNCAQEGIIVGSNSIARNNIVDQNKSDGIYLFEGGIANSNSVNGNGGTGIFTNGSTTIIGNSVTHNHTGLSSGAGALYVNNVFFNNGFNVGGGVNGGGNACDSSLCP